MSEPFQAAPQPDIAPVQRDRDEFREANRDVGRDRTRERRYRDDDLGPSVVGFGGDVPAFMLVAARPRRLAEHVKEDAGEVQ